MFHNALVIQRQQNEEEAEHEKGFDKLYWKSAYFVCVRNRGVVINEACVAFDSETASREKASDAAENVKERDEQRCCIKIFVCWVFFDLGEQPSGKCAADHSTVKYASGEAFEYGDDPGVFFYSLYDKSDVGEAEQQTSSYQHAHAGYKQDIYVIIPFVRVFKSGDCHCAGNQYSNKRAYHICGIFTSEKFKGRYHIISFRFGTCRLGGKLPSVPFKSK